MVMPIEEETRRHTKNSKDDFFRVWEHLENVLIYIFILVRIFRFNFDVFSSTPYYNYHELPRAHPATS